MLNNETVVINGVRFLGSTLWTDFRFYGESEAWHSRQRAKRYITDFEIIKYRGATFTPEDSVVLHEASKAWLDGELETSFDGPTVVVTHHLPSELSVAKQYAGDPFNPAFASRLEHLIEKHSAELWIHGHTHVPCDYELFGTRVICNPRGYPSEPSGRGFSPALVVEV